MDVRREADRASRRIVWLALGAGVALRLARPEVHSFWIDEGMTVAVALDPDPLRYAEVASHPPLSFLLVRAWAAVFGTSDFALRLLPAIASCAALFLFAPLARAWIGARRGAWAVLLAAVSPLLVWYAHEVRMYAFVELATLLVLWAARNAWRRPTPLRLAALACATAFATRLHYYGSLAWLAVLVQAIGARERPWFRTALATTAGVAVWIPWLVLVLPAQTSGVWPVIVQASWRDLPELPARLLACDLVVLSEHGIDFVGWTIGGLALLGAVVGVVRAFVLPTAAERGMGPRYAALALLVPVAGAWILAHVAGGGFQPRYLTPSIPCVAACVTAGLLALPPRSVGRVAVLVLTLALAATTVLQLAGNRREDYRSAAREIAECWQEGDRLLLLVCVPAAHQGAALEHHLRDRPDILASRLDAEAYLEGSHRPPSGTRLHVVWREATLCWEPMQRFETTHSIVERSPARFRIQRPLSAVP
jgi:mannosyltransferase